MMDCVCLVKIHIVLGIIFLVSGRVQGSGACSSSAPLPDAARRSLSNNGTSPYISDRTLASGWYSAMVNNFYYALTDKKPNFAFCGTYNPIYLKDPLPKLEEQKEVDLIACYLDYDSDCKRTYKVKARLCHGIPQYYLIPTDGQSAYCFERTNISRNAPAPTETIGGEIVVSVALFYKKGKYAYEPYLDFKCNFAEIRNKPQYYYEVTWFINDRAELTKERVRFSDIDVTNLNESEILRLKYSMGITIKCGVRISSTVNGNQTRQQLSDNFFVGLKIRDPVLTFDRGSTATVIVTPTIPVGCSKPFVIPDGKEPCGVTIELFNPNSTFRCQDTQISILSDQKLCGSEISGWRKSSSHTCLGKHNRNFCRSTFTFPSITMRVKSTNQLSYKQDETFSLQLKTSSDTNHEIWRGQILDRVQINVRDNGVWQSRSCYAVVDPQIRTFDGASWTMRERGEFVLYRHKALNMQVQIKTYDCGYIPSVYGSCICATAIEAGGDIFLIDICKIKNVNFISCRGNVLNVRQIDSHNYKVYLPTGTYVNIIDKDTFLKVFVYSSPSDVSNTEGICGNFNRNSNDDSRSPLKVKDSLFNILSHSPMTNWEYKQTVCICPKIKDKSLPTSSTGSGLLNEAICTKKDYATCTETVNLLGEQKTCIIREKRSISRHNENIRRRMKYSREETSVKMKRDVPDLNHSNITFDHALNICLSVFKSKKVYNMRDAVSNTKLNSSLEACARDAMIDSGNELWLQAHFESWADIVLNEFGRNTSFVKKNPVVVNTFKADACPYQCFNNGVCVNGTCVCKEGYVGDACFVKRDAVLNITDIEGNGKCDLSYGDDCHHCLQFHTENLLDDFRCQILSLETKEDGSVQNRTATIKRGDYESVYEGYCCPEEMDNHIHRRSIGNSPFVTEYQISVSNDGKNFGSPRSVYVYDSTCQDYTVLPSGNLIFSLKDDTCFIDGKCLKNNQQMLNSNCLLCSSKENKFQWTDGCKSSTGSEDKAIDNEDEESDVMVYAIALSLTSVVVIGIVAVVVICKFNTKKKRNVGAPPNEIHEYEDLKFGPSKVQYMPHYPKESPLFTVSK